MPALDPVAERIWAVIDRRGLSQRKLCELADIDETTWYRRKRRGGWRTGELVRIARVLRTSVETLAGT